MGTRDPSPMLCIPAALDFFHAIGGNDIYAHNHDLAVAAAAMFGERFGGPVGASPSMTSAISLAPLPVILPATLGAGMEEAQALRDHLLYKQNIEVPIYARAGRLWARLSAQVYCQMSDFEILADAVVAWAAKR